jgi:two-component system response regulator YesN
MRGLLEGNRFLLPREGISALEAEWVAPYMKKLLSCKPDERIGEETRALSLILELMSRITKASMDLLAFEAHTFPTSAVAYSEMVVSYIIKNYRKKISVIDIAEEFGLTPNYLHAIFKQVKGTTIIDYLTTYRMDMAKTYIERFGLRAYEAAELVGIDDPAYFSRLFKKMYKKSISDFKRGAKQ